MYKARKGKSDPEALLELQNLRSAISSGSILLKRYRRFTMKPRTAPSFTVFSAVSEELYIVCKLNVSPARGFPSDINRQLSP
jgi:hypothetical protein